ncbi:D-alanyl-D-alanine carboxypeptidase family protein [Pseudalkalibacillus sp. SCS-8]|uniref:D-alanyl-D-alanine carboxypeptidase family protein n=1 Tax=Pseudalkalibacillus nanhaiensis TaxID=3115291 RepID=UPI0032DA6F5F
MKQKKIFLLTPFLIVFLLLMPLHSFAESERPDDLYSETFVIMDAVTGKVLAENDADRRMYPASITKIVTGILAIESGRMDEQVTISGNAVRVDGTRVYLVEGEQMSLRQLVQGLMINSGNDAAIAIAEHLSGSVEEFSKEMNALVKDRLGLEGTHFVNPSGLYEDDHYTTAADMARITQYALENKEFREIVGTKKMDWIGKSWETTLYNHHKLLWRYDGTFGVKNGYTNQSQHTLVTAATKEDTSLIVVTMKSDTSEQAYSDTTELLNYGFDHFETKKLEKGTVYVDENGNEYTLKEDKFFTVKIGETYETMVNEEGTLLVHTDTDEEIASFPLLPDTKQVMDEEPAEAVMGKVEVDETEKNGFSWVSILFGGLIILFLLAVIRWYRVKKKRKQKRLRMERMKDEIHRFRR